MAVVLGPMFSLFVLYSYGSLHKYARSFLDVLGAASHDRAVELVSLSRRGRTSCRCTSRCVRSGIRLVS